MKDYRPIVLLTSAAAALLAAGGRDHAIEVCWRAVAIADDYDHPGQRAEAYLAISGILRDAGQIDDAVLLAEQAVPVFIERLGPDSILSTNAQTTLKRLREEQRKRGTTS